MKKTWIAASALALLLIPALALAKVVLKDTFLGQTVMNSVQWHIPTWVSPTDGTFVGRTQFRVSQNASLPAIVKNKAVIQLDSYNPTGFSFYGTDVLSNQVYALENGQGLDITFRAKMDATPEIVGGLFLYALTPGSNTLHNEIDFELVGTHPNQVQTNIYGDEPLGAGHPAFVDLPHGTIAGFHKYRIVWFAGTVSWYVDGALKRRVTSNIPQAPMSLHLNIWAPAADWAEAYSATIQPVNNPASNTTWVMQVNSVVVKTIKVPPV